MTQAQAELIDIDFLCYLIDESYEEHWEGDIVTFVHPRRGKLTAIQSGRAAMLIPGRAKDCRALPVTAEVVALRRA